MTTSAPSLIETMRVQADGRIPLLDLHMSRLQASGKALGYACDSAAIRAAVLTSAGMPAEPGPQRLRLLLDAAGTHHIQTFHLPALPPGQGVCLWPARLQSAQPLLRHKTTHRPWYDEVTSWLGAHTDIFDAVLSNERGELCEGSRTNVYLLLAGTWYTPPLECGCLPGVQRTALLDAGLARERILYEDDFNRAGGVRLSNALRGWFDATPRHGARA
jgi:4-amino-4-deoxychorismate lyase